MPLARAELVEPREKRRGRQRLAVDGDGIALLEADLDGRRLVGRVLRRNGALIDVSGRLDRRVFQHLAFGRGVQEIGVDREGRFAALVLGDRDLVLLGEVDQVGARGEVPFPPRRDDLDVGIERVIGELEAHLVIALAGGAMSDGVGAGLARDLDLPLGDQRARDGRAEEIDAFIERVGAEHREDEVAHEFLAQILDEDLLDAEQLRLLRAGSSSSPWPRSAVKVTTSQP